MGMYVCISAASAVRGVVSLNLYVLDHTIPSPMRGFGRALVITNPSCEYMHTTDPGHNLHKSLQPIKLQSV